MHNTHISLKHIVKDVVKHHFIHLSHHPFVHPSGISLNQHCALNNVKWTRGFYFVDGCDIAYLICTIANPTPTNPSKHKAQEQWKYLSMYILHTKMLNLLHSLPFHPCTFPSHPTLVWMVWFVEKTNLSFKVHTKIFHKLNICNNIFLLRRF